MELSEEILDEADVLFHDARAEDVDPAAHARYVMERVLDRGTLRSVAALVRLYGEDRIREEMVAGRLRLDPRTVSLWHSYLGITKEECTSKPSARTRSAYWTA